MILLLALLQAAPAAPAPDDDLVIIGRRLESWRGAIRTNPFGTKCVTKHSTGDPEIDAVGCTALERCWPDTLPRMKAAHARGVAPAEGKRLEAEAIEAFTACAKPQRAALIESLRDRRAAARAGTTQ